MPKDTSSSGEATTPRTRERSTRQFQAVQDELAAGTSFRSAQQLHAAIRASGVSIGLATVYRAIQTLVETGQADVLRTESGEALYRDCSGAHHHHLVCRSCSMTVEISGPTVERWADSIAAEHGYTEVSHTLELFGYCAECQTRR